MIITFGISKPFQVKPSLHKPERLSNNYHFLWGWFEVLIARGDITDFRVESFIENLKLLMDGEPAITFTNEDVNQYE